MVDFSKLASMAGRECAECGAPFHGTPDDDLCSGHRYQRDHPETAPGYWTWTRMAGDRWGAAALWRENQPMPEPGDVITVHRRDGSEQERTIAEVRDQTYDTAGNPRVRCTLV